MKVFDLELLDSYYYIKRNTIVEKITFNNRTFYAKFERIDEPLTPLLLAQHLQGDYTIAIPLLKEKKTDYLVIEYKGDEALRFQHLIRHLFLSLKIEEYYLLEGKTSERIQVFIKVNSLSLIDADKKLQDISNALKTKMAKSWKYLPTLTLPDDYNIVTLPYKKI